VVFLTFYRHSNALPAALLSFFCVALQMLVLPLERIFYTIRRCVVSR